MTIAPPVSSVQGEERFGYLISQNTYHGKTKEVSFGYKDLVCTPIAISIIGVETNRYTARSGKTRLTYDYYDKPQGADADKIYRADLQSSIASLASVKTTLGNLYHSSLLKMLRRTNRAICYAQ